MYDRLTMSSFPDQLLSLKEDFWVIFISHSTFDKVKLSIN